MVRSLKLFALLLTLVAMLVVPAAVSATPAASTPAQDARDFSILNNSSTPIQAVYVSHTTAEEWGENVLSSPIEVGEERGFTFAYPEAGRCTYWVFIQSDTKFVELADVDLCTISRFIFNEDTTSWE